MCSLKTKPQIFVGHVHGTRHTQPIAKPRDVLDVFEHISIAARKFKELARALRMRKARGSRISLAEQKIPRRDLLRVVFAVSVTDGSTIIIARQLVLIMMSVRRWSRCLRVRANSPSESFYFPKHMYNRAQSKAMMMGMNV